jgi:hypothetical protein
MADLITLPNGMGEAAYDYGNRLQHFRDSYDIPPGLFNEPDHVVFKTADQVDFADKTRAIRPFAEAGQVAFAEINWRFLAAAQMIVPLTLWGTKRVGWVELMEPKSNGEYEYPGLEYAAFYYPNVMYAQIILNSRRIDSEMHCDEARNWRWLNVVMNKEGQEVRFSDTKLVEVVESELEDGTARLI